MKLIVTKVSIYLINFKASIFPLIFSKLLLGSLFLLLLFLKPFLVELRGTRIYSLEIFTPTSIQKFYITYTKKIMLSKNKPSS